MNKRALSLIEVVVATTLLALATLVAVGALPAMTMSSNRARFQVEALELAQGLLEQQRASAWMTIATYPYRTDLASRPLERTGIVFLPKLEIDQVAGYDPMLLRRVQVTVEWSERDAIRRVQHETMVSNVPRF